jgi:hypothetical protein
MDELLGIFLFSAAVSAVFWVWTYISTYGERKRDKALGFNKDDMPFVSNFGGWLLLSLIVTFALWVFSR